MPSDKGFLLKDKKSEDGEKGFEWRSLFRLHSWWSVVGMLTIALLVVWFSIRGLPWSSAGAAVGEFVGLSSFPPRLLGCLENSP
jgi:beta-glucosidase